ERRSRALAVRRQPLKADLDARAVWLRGIERARELAAPAAPARRAAVQRELPELEVAVLWRRAGTHRRGDKNQRGEEQGQYAAHAHARSLSQPSRELRHRGRRN